jgi:OPA family glycerol-3-phosphate transporter-like MFS transporter
MLGPGGEPLLTNADFGMVFGVGTAVYGCSFVVNGPLTDRIGGRKAILLGATGAVAANLLMGWVAYTRVEQGLAGTLAVLYALNMYFQSFGAVAIVKLNAPWFHVRERGVFGAIFGILISLGIYFAFDVSERIVAVWPLQWVFWVPVVLLSATALAVAAWAADTPAEAGFTDFDPEDASSGDDGPRLPVRRVFARMLRDGAIMTIACIEFCSGFLRQAIMQWYRTFAKATDLDGTFVYENWGMLLCCAGILGGVFAGIISDRVFGSRRGPVAAVLYAFLLVGAVALVTALGTPALGLLVVFMSMCVIGVHGMLSGTASMDFGGRKNAGIAVGIIDGFVYMGTAVMAFTYGSILPQQDDADYGDLAAWLPWPLAMIPVAVLGLVLARRVWHARPTPRRHA